MNEYLDYTQIQVEKKFRDWLTTKGKKSETFDEILKRLCKYKEGEK